MATLSHLPPIQSLSSNKLLSIPLPIFHGKLQCYYLQNLPRICCSLTKKSRATRKAKSDAELLNDIKEFLSAVGLPQDHVPSTKKLLHHGRQDLANIVRRRGYKFMRKLLAGQIQQPSEKLKDLADDISLSSETTEVKRQTEDLAEDVSLPIEATKDEENTKDLADDISLSSKTAEVVRQTEDLAEDVSLPSEASKDEENTKDLAYDTCLSSEATEVERQTEDLAEDVSLPSEATKDEENMKDLADDISFSSEATEVERQTEDLAEDVSLFSDATKGKENMMDLAEDVSLLQEATISKDNIRNVEMSGELKPHDHSYTDPDYSLNPSLQEKVAKFLQDGELDEIEEFTKSQDAVESKYDYFHVANEDLAFSGAAGSDLSNGHITLSSQPVEHSAWEINASSVCKTEVLSDEKVMVVNQNEDLDVEAQKAENQAEISRLKYMLHQKELELTRLKEQIEKEKLALSILQTKAEKEISEAQKLISEKDAELHAAEESLSELKEIEIQYWGEGEIIEVAGSFNGWHQRIKMDPLPSSSISDLTGSRKRSFTSIACIGGSLVMQRKSQLWRTVLWLYPGVYEIKFITDGHWTIDPQRESVTRGSIHNNVLRVDR